ncbi:MAG: hypothetical protein AAGI54_08140 [Planctomycetota bacterium]
MSLPETIIIREQLDRLDARLAVRATPDDRIPRPDGVDWSEPPPELEWPIYHTIELEGRAQPFPWDRLPKDAPPGHRIVIKPRRRTPDGRPDNVRPVIDDAVRWSRKLDGTVLEFQNLILRPKGNSAFFRFGEELDTITRNCLVRGDHGDGKDALNHHKTGFTAVIDTTISGCAFGLKGCDYAENVRISNTSDDGIQDTDTLVDVEVTDLIRYTAAHPDVCELGRAKGLRWDGFAGKRFDGQGFAASSCEDCWLLNGEMSAQSEYDAAAFGVHILRDFHWLSRRPIQGTFRVGKVEGVARFVGVPFQCPQSMIDSAARLGVQFESCTNYGELIRGVA